MKAYKVNMARMRSIFNRIITTPEQKLVLWAAYEPEPYYTHRDLRMYGVGDHIIRESVKSGLIEEVEITDIEAKKLCGKSTLHRIRTDPDYKDQLVEYMKKAREVLDEKPEIRMENLEKARKAKDKHLNRRRKLLYGEVVLQFFGTHLGDSPDAVSILDVVDSLKQVPDVYELYEKMDVYDAVRRDLKGLNVQIDDGNERISETLREKMKTDIVYASRVKNHAREMTDKRKKIYEKSPDIKREAEKLSAETRRRKMEEDPEFREQTMARLSLGNVALQKKRNSDIIFKKELREKALKGLRKGHETMRERGEKRRKALLQEIIEPRYGNLSNVSARVMTEYLANDPDFLGEYYYNISNLESVIKKTL